MAYVTDTTAKPDAPYIKEIRGVDLLVHECYFADDQTAWADKTGHSHTAAVARVARQASVGRLLLVHINPLSLDADPDRPLHGPGHLPPHRLGRGPDGG